MRTFHVELFEETPHSRVTRMRLTIEVDNGRAKISDGGTSNVIEYNGMPRLSDWWLAHYVRDYIESFPGSFDYDHEIPDPSDADLIKHWPH